MTCHRRAFLFDFLLCTSALCLTVLVVHTHLYPTVRGLGAGGGAAVWGGGLGGGGGGAGERIWIWTAVEENE